MASNTYDNFERRTHSLRRSTYVEDREREIEREREREREKIRREAFVSSTYHRYDDPISSTGATYRQSISNYNYDDSNRYSQYSQYYQQSSTNSIYTPSSYVALRDSYQPSYGQAAGLGIGNSFSNYLGAKYPATSSSYNH